MCLLWDKTCVYAQLLVLKYRKLPVCPTCATQLLSKIPDFMPCIDLRDNHWELNCSHVWVINALTMHILCN